MQLDAGCLEDAVNKAQDYSHSKVLLANYESLQDILLRNRSSSENSGIFVLYSDDQLSNFKLFKLELQNGEESDKFMLTVHNYSSLLLQQRCSFEARRMSEASHSIETFMLCKESLNAVIEYSKIAKR